MIEVDQNTKIQVIIKKAAYCGYFSSYEMAKFKNGEIEKILSFNQWDDYGFRAFIFNDNLKEINRIDFNIEKSNPLYNSINRFLGKEDLIIIDDDDTREINKKTLQFLRSNDEIIVTFSNELYKNEIEKFNIFVKNILIDYRSKIDDGNFDTKDRLYRLFENLREELCPETLNEYPIKSDEVIMKRTYTKNLLPNNRK